VSAAVLAPALLVSVLATAGLARWAGRVRWTDDPASAPGRKRQAAPVPAVGGTAILLGLSVALWAGEARLVAAWPALAAAWLVGLVDDLRPRGLPPAALLAGQAFAAALLVVCGFGLHAHAPAALSLLAGIAALNAMNTFDNADGAAASVGAAGLLPAASLLAAPLLGFLPFNLARRAYLGNSGSHLLGVLVLLDPVAAWCLVLPALDLARVALERARAGAPVWRGDRRHLAHRLEQAGRSALAVALVQCAIAFPPVLGAHLAGPRGGLAGALVTGASLAFALKLAPPKG